MTATDMIDTLFFVMGGVVTRHVWEAACDLLAIEGPRDQMALLDLEKALYRGIVDIEGYCQRAIDQTQADVTPGDLADLIPARMAPMPGILSVIDELAARYRLHLVADYPPPWCDAIVERLALAKHFAAVHTAPDYKLNDYFTSIVEVLIASGIVDAASCLWIDSNPARTRAAIRRDVFAALFVDGPRLRRDLVLWGLVPAPLPG